MRSHKLGWALGPGKGIIAHFGLKVPNFSWLRDGPGNLVKSLRVGWRRWDLPKLSAGNPRGVAEIEGPRKTERGGKQGEKVNNRGDNKGVEQREDK